ncbi:alpha/beta fold hydrolase [Kitasatospora sp. McL0602]|uniref:alpha/beta fold hydrolase n=1 Tax=Kitasatospora sp. McL0602 TaxID=3439530 RepID=UPI003F8C95F6
MPRQLVGGRRVAQALVCGLVTALLMLTAAPAGARAARSAAIGVDRIAWTPCPDPAAARFRAQCAQLTVPLDWAEPDGPATALALMRVPATGTPRGTVLADSEELGGYGGSQIAYFLQHGDHYLALLPRVHASMDIVVADPRGLGDSSALHCPLAAHDPAVSGFPSDAADLRRLAAHNASTFEACRAASGPLLAWTGLRSQARDIDAVRAALGQRALNWIGQATGGELGVVYAAMFPRRTGRMVLDTVVDPYRSAITGVLDVARAEEAGFAHFVSWCAGVSTDQCVLHGRDPGQVFDSVVTKAAKGMVDGGSLGRPLTAPEVRIAAGTFLVGYPVSWRLLSTAIAQADSGDGTVLGDFVALTYSDPDNTGSRAQACADQPTPATDWSQLHALTEEMAALAPHTGGSSVAWDVYTGCLGRPNSGPPLAATLPARIHPSSTVLVTATTGDPINPYTWGRDVANRLAGSRLLTADANGHGGLDNSPCAAAAIDTYISTGTLPPPGLHCGTAPQ